jgi:hypothetical protein
MNQAPGSELINIWQLVNIWDYWEEHLFSSPDLADGVLCFLAWEDRPTELYFIRARLRREIQLYYDYWGCLDAPLP